MKTIDLDTMIERLRAGGANAITWLIGAGFSASAGIPLASGVCKRLLTFHYLQRQVVPPPYGGSQIENWTESYIRPFLAWADKDDSKFEELAHSARRWAKDQENLKDYLDDDQRLYARLFEEVTPGPESRAITESCGSGAGMKKAAYPSA
jgi:hypothetical protein